MKIASVFFVSLLIALVAPMASASSSEFYPPIHPPECTARFVLDNVDHSYGDEIRQILAAKGYVDQAPNGFTSTQQGDANSSTTTYDFGKLGYVTIWITVYYSKLTPFPTSNRIEVNHEIYDQDDKSSIQSSVHTDNYYQAKSRVVGLNQMAASRKMLQMVRQIPACVPTLQ